jgi:hypothetical protein
MLSARSLTQCQRCESLETLLTLTSLGKHDFASLPGEAPIDDNLKPSDMPVVFSFTECRSYPPLPNGQEATG